MLQAKARLATTQAHWRGVPLLVGTTYKAVNGDSCNHAYSGVSASILLKLFRHPAWNVRASPNFKALRSFSCLRVGPSPNSERAFSYSVHLASVVVLERLVPATLRWSQSRQTLLPALQEEDTSSPTHSRNGASVHLSCRAQKYQTLCWIQPQTTYKPKRGGPGNDSKADRGTQKARADTLTTRARNPKFLPVPSFQSLNPQTLSRAVLPVASSQLLYRAFML